MVRIDWTSIYDPGGQEEFTRAAQSSSRQALSLRFLLSNDTSKYITHLLLSHQCNENTAAKSVCANQVQKVTAPPHI
ncbi:hypothetical protein WG66_009061 [Moniliophthora roreri]|nr:hypothetical protein WG66_009061 [Moniliophthora roreri]